MPLHLLKLCVGCDSIAELEQWIHANAAARRGRGEPEDRSHTTRMVPKRTEELCDGGSLYWVIKGQIACRQPLKDIVPFKDASGIGRCHLVLRPEIFRVEPRPCRPFQGWRYLTDQDAPRDLGSGTAAIAEMPDAMRRELAALGLI
jgi:hypothetical protein